MSAHFERRTSQRAPGFYKAWHPGILTCMTGGYSAVRAGSAISTWRQSKRRQVIGRDAQGGGTKISNAQDTGSCRSLPDKVLLFHRDGLQASQQLGWVSGSSFRRREQAWDKQFAHPLVDCRPCISFVGICVPSNGDATMQP